MDGYFELFLATGHPLFYLLHCQKENAVPETRSA